jgi:twitching motility protein PilT
MKYSLDEMILYAFERKASDLFVRGNAVPAIRQHGKITSTEYPELSPDEVKELCYSKMTPRQQAVFEQHMEMDLAFNVGEELRIRMNIYQQRGTTATVCRLIPTNIRSLDELGIPPKVKEFTTHRNGLILVTGPTGSGKTTTLAAMIDLINQTRKVNIITLEDQLNLFTKTNKRLSASAKSALILKTSTMRCAMFCAKHRTSF